MMAYTPKFKIAPEIMVVGRRSFPFRMVTVQGRIVSFGEGRW